MARAENTELVDSFEQFYRNYYREEIGQLAQNYPGEQRTLAVDWQDLYRYDPDLADDYLSQPEQLQEYAEEALRIYDLPVDVSLGRAHVRVHNLPETTEIREIRSRHVGQLLAVQGIVRKATDVRPKIEEAAFECQRCGTLTYIPQSSSDFQEPHECQGCERQGPFNINFDQSEFVDAQRLRVQESPEGLRGGETPQSVDVTIEDDITGEVTPGDHVTVTGILHLQQQGNDQDKSPIFDVYMEGVSVEIEDEEFEDMEISEEDKAEIVELSNDPDIYQKMIESMAPSIYGYDQEKLAIILQLFSGVTKHLPDGSRIRGDLHMLLIGDPGTGKSQLLQYIRELSPRSVYTSGKGSSSAGLTAAAVRDDFGDGQQWTLEAGALVLADKGVAAVDELDKMRCVTGDTLVHTADGIVRIDELAAEATQRGAIEEHDNGRTIRDVDLRVWTLTENERLVQRPVTAIHEYDAPESLHEVTLETGESLTVTPDHPFIALEEGDRTEIPAADLDSGEWVYVPDGIPTAETDGGVTTSGRIDGASPTDSELTPSHGAVLGYLAGDGNIFHDREEGVYGIRFTNTEEQLLSDFEDACETAFEATPVRHPSEQRDGVGNVRLHGKAHLQEVLDAGANLEIYDGKCLPESVTRADRETKAAFVRALADSEGSVEERCIKIHSASYDLLLGVKMLLTEFGVTSQIQHRENEDKRDLYILVVTADDSLRRYNQHIGFTLDRKQNALDQACGVTTGTRTIVDVVPDIGCQLQAAREALRLYVSECGLNDATYCNFENGDANLSFDCGVEIIEAFEERKRTAKADLEKLDESSGWDRIQALKQRYHVSQSELAEGTPYTQQQVSYHWGESEDLRRTVVHRLRTILLPVAGVDFSRLRDLVRGDTKWRRVDSVVEVSPEDANSRARVLSNQLADRVGTAPDEAISTARELLDYDPVLTTNTDVVEAIDTFSISQNTVAERVGVDQATISRWVNDEVPHDHERLASACREIIRDRQAELRALIDGIERRQETNVYDLTVEGTHNFVANGMVVHNSEDRSAMHEALEQQSISISKAGINATLKSRCSLLGAANPKYGRFDQYEPIGEQIDLEPALISRFDLIFTVTDQPDEEEDAQLAEHIIQTNFAGELNTQRTEMATPNVTREQVDAQTEEVEPTIDAELLRKYVAHAKSNVFPTMTEDAQEAIQQFYVDLRSKGTDEDAPVPVTARKLEALVRLAEASARVRLSDTVEVEDAERVIEIVRSCLQDIGVDPETGQFDADVVETGQSKTQRDRIKNIKQLIADVEEDYEDGAPVEVVMDRVDEIGMDQTKAEREIEKLKQKGEVYEPNLDHLRTA
ncbi:replicative DNA helicase Mcm [Natronoarchaeum philippinense]|uniref:DNA helicase n=1 Tax=Natronoarchaeum philippinense TaxID=558529 RepID=A0A285P3X4_NATPI|nr:LAGLIDADG family homing endonuclease [Natronoarchaeum philippinense]SNZ14856.1 replicative DNA helicase Mcm [Natronoarchaeum philippinense]